MSDPLARYREKRDFSSTPEPSGETRKPGTTPLFVVQEHDASTHHFDLRLEVDGVLVSWAVPRGPSMDPNEQRLAVRTEDHPLAYGDFEGRIPEDSYGAGTVLVWDLGPYRNLSVDDDGEIRPVATALQAGHVVVWLEGHKLRGGWALRHASIGGDTNNWLLVKLDDETADARRNPTSTEPHSALSGRTIEQVARADDAPVHGGDDDADA